jgi:hypothetical protein
MNPADPVGSLESDTELVNNVAELLAGYLLADVLANLPGTDGLTVADAVGAFYNVEARAGHVPDSTELARRHPKLAEKIAAFLTPR